MGGLSNPGKMPWYSYSIPAEYCKVGSKLRQDPGSVCAKCYATRGRYVFPSVALALERRYQAVLRCPSAWAANMTELLDRKSQGKARHFRWHDSGDLIGAWHFEAIIWIAQQLGHIRFWLPSKEYGVVRSLAHRLPTVPNLTVRVSAPKVGQVLENASMPTSSVSAGIGHACPAYSQGSKCGDCRACWDRNTVNVDYPLH